ncbi:hypothetical protein ACFZB9_22505 [Kitasatospora sp. NPDC008050]|uniref:hypothetical protein n=1 Tax=Kitasatospora sp. NPDC008050 TaxID=3364021 RepID=UPI0036E30B38
MTGHQQLSSDARLAAFSKIFWRKGRRTVVIQCHGPVAYVSSQFRASIRASAVGKRVWRNRRFGSYAPSWDPAGDHSPNSLFAASMVQGGFALQIPAAELYYQLLPTHRVMMLELIGGTVPVEQWPTLLTRAQRIEPAREMAQRAAAAADRPASAVGPVPVGDVLPELDTVAIAQGEQASVEIGVQLLQGQRSTLDRLTGSLAPRAADGTAGPVNIAPCQRSWTAGHRGVQFQGQHVPLETLITDEVDPAVHLADRVDVVADWGRDGVPSVRYSPVGRQRPGCRSCLATALQGLRWSTSLSKDVGGPVLVHAQGRRPTPAPQGRDREQLGVDITR